MGMCVSVCVCLRVSMRVGTQNTIVLRWWLWWRIRPPKRCFLHQINLNYNQFRWWLWFEETAVATATVALCMFGFSEFPRCLFFLVQYILSWFVFARPCFCWYLTTILNERENVFKTIQSWQFIPFSNSFRPNDTLFLL